MNKWLKAGAILIFLILLFIPTIIAMKYVAISQIYSHFVDSVSNLTGLNKYLVKAGVAGIAGAPTPPPRVKAQQRVEAGGFLFELQNCKLSGGSCDVFVVSYK